jgi:hypothetical protein
MSETPGKKRKKILKVRWCQRAKYLQI